MPSSGTITNEPMHSAKRQKTVHTLPPTHNGSVVTVTVDDSRYDAETNIEISVARSDGTMLGSGNVTLTPHADTAASTTDSPNDPSPTLTSAGDGTLRCLKLPPELSAGLLENVHPHPLDARIKFREADHKPVFTIPPLRVPSNDFRPFGVWCRCRHLCRRPHSRARAATSRPR